ncbi:hypothetical protein BKP43_55750 [Variovorax boronicumulans]|uniref:GspH/FimT family pseudopilin n=1 Tax=Variovorax boronicumulans TaxID=436515 RepID=UPI000BB2FBA3|nr:GspH/FimT family pseudopilin [Variovorax boronicumulans]PBI83807.1 hypothetical protein BKP43_55750 [Variovorax boronicumulans]
MKDQRGFTIIELMLSIAVLAVILMIATPNIDKWLDNTRIRNAAAALQDGLQRARTEAVNRNQNVSFYLVSQASPGALDNNCALSSTSAGWVVSVNSPVSKCADSPSTTTSPMIVLGRPSGDSGGGVRVSAKRSDGTTDATTVTFNGFGRVVNTGDAISWIEVNGPLSTATYRKLRVTVAAAGATRVCDPDAATGSPRRC